MGAEEIVIAWLVQLADKDGQQGAKQVLISIDETLNWLRYLMETIDEEESFDSSITITVGTMSRKAIDELPDFQGF